MNAVFPRTRSHRIFGCVLTLATVYGLIGISRSVAQQIPDYSKVRKSVNDRFESCKGLSLTYERESSMAQARSGSASLHELQEMTVSHDGRVIETIQWYTPSASRKDRYKVCIHSRQDRHDQRFLRAQYVVNGEVDEVDFGVIGFRDPEPWGLHSELSVILGHSAADDLPLDYLLSQQYTTSDMQYEELSGVKTLRLTRLIPRWGKYELWFLDAPNLRLHQYRITKRAGDQYSSGARPSNMPQLLLGSSELVVGPFKYKSYNGREIIEEVRMEWTSPEIAKSGWFSWKLTDVLAARPISPRFEPTDFRIPDGTQVHMKDKDSPVRFEWHNGEVRKVVDQTALQCIANLETENANQRGTGYRVGLTMFAVLIAVAVFLFARNRHAA